ncbi:polysaccharide deacetylase family protein [Treponema sp. OttesenSCG-928-L16]|nr:polysaccharide deacetylase family protein [Treponema sp. OttesenSCG-928-L16]
MNKLCPLLWALVCFLLFSCAAGRPAVSGPEDTPGISYPAENMEEEFTPIDRIAAQIAAGFDTIDKYFEKDPYGALTVKSSIDHYEVIYDLMNPLDLGDSRFRVAFSVEDLTSRAIRNGTLLWKPQDDLSGILLSLDDDYFEVWKSYFDFFDRFGVRITFFVNGGFADFPLLAQSRGHEVGYHTINHYNLPKLGRDVFFEETRKPADACGQENGAFAAFAFPFGLSEEWMRDELLRSYNILRGFGVTFRLYDADAVRGGYISSKSIDNIIYKTDEEFESDILYMLRITKFIGAGSILPLTSHTISDDADWGIKPARLEYLFKTAHDLKLRFYLYRDFF